MKVFRIGFIVCLVCSIFTGALGAPYPTSVTRSASKRYRNCWFSPVQCLLRGRQNREIVEQPI